MVSKHPTFQTANDLDRAAQHLAKAKQVLFATGVIGQLIFVYYIVSFYGGIVWNGTYEKVNEQLPHGIMEDDPIGNAMLAVHLFLAAVITFGGPIQFIGAIRQKFPKFHRWNGRIYFITAFIISFAGTYMNVTRGTHGGSIGFLGNSLNAIFIWTFSALAWQTAVRRDFVAHKKWALRAFVAVSGVWFFRIGYGLWILLTGFTAVGSNADLTGPFDRFLSIGHAILPLAILEFYFFAKASTHVLTKKWATYFLGLLSLLLAAGIIMVSMIFWF